MPSAADVVGLLVELGGVARWRALSKVVERSDIDAAVAQGLIIREARGVYVLPGVDEATRVAEVARGVLSHASAALCHGWPVKSIPAPPHVTVSRGRTVPRGLHVSITRAQLRPQDVCDGYTTAERTLLDCLRSLPFADALAIADSALREEGCHQMLARLAWQAAGPGSRQVRRVAAAASELAANPFESTLRAHCLDIPGLAVRPQVDISDDGFIGRVDLADERLRLVIEADSFAWHGKRAALVRDTRRYNRLTLAGWWVLRFSYEDVMFDPVTVKESLRAGVRLTEVMNKRGPNARKKRSRAR